MEQWKDISGFEGMYQVSDTGQVRSLDRFDDRGRHLKGRVLSQGSGTKGYKMTVLSKLGVHTTRNTHRFVAKAFIPNPDNLPSVNHMDGNKQNNHVSNLEWVTQKENIRHAMNTGLTDISGEKNNKAVLTEEDVRMIRKIYISGSQEFGQVALGRKFGVSPNTIGFIVKGKTWKHVA